MDTAAAEGALRENLFDNEEPGGGARRLAGRGAAAGGTTTDTCTLTRRIKS